MMGDLVKLAVILQFVADSQAFADERLTSAATKARGEANLEAAVTRATSGGSSPRADSAHISTLAARRVVTGVDPENLTSALINQRYQSFYGQDGLIRPIDAALQPVEWAYDNAGSTTGYDDNRIPAAKPTRGYYADIQNPLPSSAETGAGALFNALA
jgi:hypothetical protein